jgi:hypothetical protein
MKNSIEIHGLKNAIAFCESQGLAKCFQAYADNCAGDEIIEIGFNTNSGYTYIALEFGVTICSMLGRECEFLTTNLDNGEEFFFSSYKEAMDFDPYKEEEQEETESAEWEFPEHDEFKAEQDSDLYHEQ